MPDVHAATGNAADGLSTILAILLSARILHLRTAPWHRVRGAEHRHVHANAGASLTIDGAWKVEGEQLPPQDLRPCSE